MVLRIRLHRQFVVFTGVTRRACVGIYKSFTAQKKKKKSLNTELCFYEDVDSGALRAKSVPTTLQPSPFSRYTVVFLGCKVFEMLKIDQSYLRTTPRSIPLPSVVSPAAVLVRCTKRHLLYFSLLESRLEGDSARLLRHKVAHCLASTYYFFLKNSHHIVSHIYFNIYIYISRSSHFCYSCSIGR